MLNKLQITKNWLPRYTGIPLDRFGDFVLVTADWVGMHLKIGIEAMTELGQKGEKIKHFRY
jgi:hypothetical protein